MELKHNDVKKEVRKEPKASKIRTFATAAVLAGGLALFGNGQARAEDGAKNAECKGFVDDSKTYTVNTGDSVPIIQGMVKTKYDLVFQVTAVDNKGVGLNTDVFMSSHSRHLAYGEEVRYGEFCIYAKVKAEKGATPGTARITVTNRVPVTKELTCLPAVNMVCLANKTVVKAGDPIIAIEFLFEKAGFFTFNVTKVDAKGIEIGPNKEYMEIFMSEHATTKPFRVNFGETKPLSEPAAGATITAVKGPEPGTAIVTVGGYTELKKTTNEKLKSYEGLDAKTYLKHMEGDKDKTTQ